MYVSRLLQRSASGIVSEVFDRESCTKKIGLGDGQANRKRTGHRREIPDKNPLPCLLIARLTIQWLIVSLPRFVRTN